MTEDLTKMTASDPCLDVLHDCHSLACRMPEPLDLFVGFHGFLSVLPENVLQFHRHSDCYLLMGAPFLHHRYVLVTCLREPGCIVVDGIIYRVRPGQGFLIFPYQSHYFTRLENPERISWLFTTFEYAMPDKLEPLRNMPLVFDAQDLQRLCQTTTAFLQAHQAASGTTHDIPLELALLLSGLLQRHQRIRTQNRGQPLPDGPQALFLNPLFMHIDQHLSKQIPLKNLAQCVHLSPSRLRARFKHILGIGIGEFVRNTRIHRACGLLNNTDLTVTQIADKCGFASVYAFSRTFRHVVGKPPTVFRQDLPQTIG